MMKGFFIISVLCNILFGNGICQRLNLASTENGATCTASSALDSSTECEKALDSIETPLENEWITSREGPGSFIDIVFEFSSIVDEIRVLQRCHDGDKAQQVQVQFDDNSIVLMDLNCMSGSESAEDCTGTYWESVRLESPVVTKSVNISVISVCATGAFNGAREIVVMGQYTEETANKNLALLHNGGTCDPSSINSATYTCEHAIDGVIGGGPDQCWISSADDVMNSYIKVVLAGRSKIRSIRLKNRCMMIHQMQTILIEFDENTYSQTVNTTCREWPSASDCPNQVWDEWSFPEIIASEVTISAVAACSTPTLMSFQEVEIYGVLESDLPCPFDFEGIPGVTSCYKFMDSSQDVSQATTTCASLYPRSHLIEINSILEQDVLARKLETFYLDGVTCSAYYTGGYRTSDLSTEWFWSYTEQRVSLPIWGINSPANGERYIKMAHRMGEDVSERWKWDSTTGSESLCFICEI